MIRRYESYKDSGVEWIGEIPEGWDVKKIKYLALGKDTLFLDGDWIESKDIVFDDSQIRYITTGNVGEGKYKEQGLTYITEETFKKLNCTEIFPDDLLISRLNPPIGRCCIVPELGNRIVTSVDNVVLRPDNIYQKSFLKYAMSNPRYYEYTSLIARGATMQRISRGLLGDVALPVTPEGEEQTAIALFLDRKTIEIDQLIANKEKLIALFEEEKTAIINRAVTRGLDSAVKTKPSGVDWLGDIPEYWDVKRLKYLTLILNDGTHGTFKRTTLGYRLLSVRNIIKDEFMFLDDDSRISEEDFDIITKPFLVAEGDLQLAIVGATLGKVAIVPKLDEKFATQRSVATIRPKQELVHNKFLFYFLKSASFQSFLWLNAGFSAQPGIYLGSLASCHIPTPGLTEQTTIVTHIETECSRLDTIIDKFKKQIELFKEYRTTLISEVVTGKIDVRGEVEE